MDGTTAVDKSRMDDWIRHWGAASTPMTPPMLEAKTMEVKKSSNALMISSEGSPEMPSCMGPMMPRLLTQKSTVTTAN